jgi:restriction system protein
MTRRRSHLQIKIQAQQEAEKRRIAQLNAMKKAQTQAAKSAEKARKDYEQARTAGLKEQARLYTESKVAQVQLQNEQIEQGIKSLGHLLLDSLLSDPYIDIQALKQPLNFPPFNPVLTYLIIRNKRVIYS